MKYLELFEENKKPYWLVLIIIDGIPETFKLFKEEESVDNFIINTVHGFLKDNSNDDYLNHLSDPYDISELMDLAAFSSEFDNYNIYVEYVDFSQKVEINPDIEVTINSKKYNL